MSSLYISASIVVPMFVYMAAGVVVRKSGMMDKNALDQMNRLVFRVFLSTSLYYNICAADLTEVFDLRLMIFAVAAQAAIAVFSLAVASVCEKSRKRRGALAHAVFHTNFVIFGTLIGTGLCGEGNIGGISLLIAVIVPLQNVISVIVLALYREDRVISTRQLAAIVIRNPYVIAAALGFVTQLAGIPFPDILEKVLRDIGRCGTPAALIVMGGLFSFSSVKGNLRSIMTGCICRLLIVPAVMIPVSLFFGFRGTDLIGLMCIFIAPCATSSFNLAKEMDSDADLTSQLVVFTSVLSILTVFMWTYVLSFTGMI